MGSDRARRTYDAGQKYRAVVAQQGRVTLEADWNEHREIDTVETRAAMVDVIGPAGTPDDGFKISIPDPLPSGWIPLDFTIGKGTYWVGGNRLTLAKDITYFGQKDGEWVDGPPAPGLDQLEHELVSLLVVEQEIGAVEDAALREVALGGPDTAERLRLVQRVQRSAVSQGGCEAALGQAIKQWAAAGLTWDAATTALSSTGRLEVDFVPAAGPVDLCQPTAQAGFLGPENQLIRVQVTADKTLLWGWDNASFLYRVTAKGGTTLELGSIPVDVFHQPRADQWVEVLRAAVHLENGEYAAAQTGFVAQLQAGYEAAGRTVTLKTALPAEYLDPDQTPRLFLRVWENQLAFTGDGSTATELATTDGTGTGVRVMTSGQAVPGDFWMLGVRPDQPQEIFPPRYLAGPQPPDGPRRWATSLATIVWQRTDGTVSDCRTTFCNLIHACQEHAGGGCCTVTVGPKDLAELSLSKLIDALVDKAAGARVTICLEPGTYHLTEPLRFTHRHSGLALSSCGAGATLEAAPGSEHEFVDGLVVLVHADNVTLEGLRLQLPAVDFAKAGGRFVGVTPRVLADAEGPRIDDLHVSIGVRAIHSAELTVRDCLFRFVVPPRAGVFGAGIFAGSECWGLIVDGCRFLHDEEYLRDSRGPLRFLAGYLLLPSTTVGDLRNERLSRVGALAGSLVRSVLADARFQRNEFAGLSVAVLSFAETGDVWLDDNKVKDCYAGFMLLALRTLGLAGGFSEVSYRRDAVDDARLLRLAVLGIHFDALLELGVVLGRAYPLPDGVDPKLVLRFDPGEAGLDERVRTARIYDEAEGEVRELFRRGVARRRPAGEAEAEAAIDEEELRFAPELADLGVYRVGRDPGLAVLNAVLAAVERRVLGKLSSDARLRLALSVSGNQINTVVPRGPSGPALMFWDYDFSTPGTVILGDNLVRNRSQSPAAWVLFVERCTITGNVIVNELWTRDDGVYCLYLLPREDQDHLAVAVTGNVLEGRRRLPKRRNVPPTLDNWELFNTAIP